MPKPNAVFKQTYQNYITQIQTLDLNPLSIKLGLVWHQNNFMISFLNKNYIISENGFFNHLNESAPYELCIVLCKYILLCPEEESQKKDWVTFRDFKDSGPLTVYFSNEVEQKISRSFAGKMEELITACRTIERYPADIAEGYDISMRFDVLPKIPVVLLFNDRDPEFEAVAKLLFEKRAAHYLDAECLAILGNILCQMLKT